MNIDILTALTLISSMAALVGAIWRVAEAKAELQQKVDKLKSDLERKIEVSIDNLGDKISASNNKFDLYSQLKSAEELRFQSEMRHRYDAFYRQYQIIKRDLWDVQSFLQKTTDFKIRINTDTIFPKSGSKNKE